MPNKNQLCYQRGKSAINADSIILRPSATEEEILQQLKQAPFGLTVKIAAAIGRIWQDKTQESINF